GDSLASVQAFQQARRDAANKPGLFIFANPARVVELLENGDLGIDRKVMQIVKPLINPKAFRAVADQLTLDSGTLGYHRRLYLDAKDKSPLLELLPGSAVPERLMHFAAPDATAFVALANDGGEQRWRRLLDFADLLAKVSGERGPAPSQML